MAFVWDIFFLLKVFFFIFNKEVLFLIFLTLWCTFYIMSILLLQKQLTLSRSLTVSSFERTCIHFMHTYRPTSYASTYLFFRYLWLRFSFFLYHIQYIHPYAIRACLQILCFRYDVCNYMYVHCTSIWKFIIFKKNLQQVYTIEYFPHISEVGKMFRMLFYLKQPVCRCVGQEHKSGQMV